MLSLLPDTADAEKRFLFSQSNVGQDIYFGFAEAIGNPDLERVTTDPILILPSG